MFMKERNSGDLILIEDIRELFNPMSESVIGRRQSGQEQQDAESFLKWSLVFPTDEALPRCWIDPTYNLDEGHVRAESHERR